jgi:ligand-binding SRPBCC domain-containing protein
VVISFECVTDTDRSSTELFDLARDIDVHRASQEQTGEIVVGGVATGLLGPGENVRWRARHFGLTFEMTSAITEFDRPSSFVDEQTDGPFRFFRHEHVFETLPAGCRMTDRVTFAAPFGPLGRMAERLVLARYMRRLIDERSTFLSSYRPGER